MTPSQYLCLLFVAWVAAGCAAQPSIDVTRVCASNDDCDTDDGGSQFTHCGTAEQEGLCCERGTEKCGCHEDDTCTEGLACYDQTLAGYPEGRFCNLEGLEWVPGLDTVN